MTLRNKFNAIFLSLLFCASALAAFWSGTYSASVSAQSSVPEGTPNCTLYGADLSGRLFTINITTAAATLVGQLPNTPSTEIEFDPISRRAFTQRGGFNNFGQEFDINTGAGIGVPIANGHAFAGLEWVGTTLYGTAHETQNGPSSLRTLDPWTGTSTLIGPTGRGPINGLAYDASTNTMYGSAGG